MALFKSKKQTSTGSLSSAAERAERVQRLSSRCSILAGICVLCIIVASVCLVSNSQAIRNTTTSSLKVLVASKSIMRGETISAESIQVQAIPASYRTSNAVEEKDASRVIGHRAVCDLSQGSQICATSVSDSDEALTLAGALPQGRLAVSVAVDATSGVSNLLVIGDKVQVYRTIDADGGLTPSSLLFPEAVSVLALDTRLSTSSEALSYTNVVLEVNAEEAALIASTQAESTHALYLALAPLT